jgi:hypothetical protein
MEEFQFKIDYNNITHISSIADFPNDKGLLYIFHANKIPPHIGWSVKDRFYSLKATGADIGLDTVKINHIILRKEIPTLIVALSDVIIEEELTNQVFSSYGEGLQQGKTCLNPIDEVLFSQIKHEKIGDLLKTLFDNQINLIFYGVNLPLSFNGIFNYSKNDIEKRIIELQ